MNHKNITQKAWWSSLILSIILLTGCSSTDTPEATDVTKMGEPVSLTIMVPTQASNPKEETRIGDPGSGSNETIDWDRLTLIVAYTKKATSNDGEDSNPEKMIYWDTFTKDEFEKNAEVAHSMTVLNAPEKGDNGTRTCTMYVPAGTIHIYGATYSKDQGLNLEETLKQIAIDGKDHNADIKALEIPNDYAKISENADNLGKFLSVATGFAIDTRTSNTQEPTDLTVSKNVDITQKQYWSMRLGRLATKLDIQWDAQGAFESDWRDPAKTIYTDVKVNSFTYNGGATTGGNATGGGGTTLEGGGSGRLFPSLQASGVKPLGGKVNFFNTTEISRRNGRVYHYFFPDGSKSPTISFHIKATPQQKADDTGSGTATGTTTETRDVDYTINFSNLSSDKFPFQKAAWYKLNVNIKGVSQSSNTVTIDKL